MNWNPCSDRATPHAVTVLAAAVSASTARAAAAVGAGTLLLSANAAAQEATTTTAADDGGTALLLYVAIGVVALVLAFVALLYLRRALSPETEDPLGR